MELTKELARRICDLRLDDLPSDVVDYSKSLTLSAFGAMIAGAEYPSGQAIVRYIEAHNSAAEATILGVWRSASVEMAAMATGTFAHATEYEDDSFPEAVSSYTLFPVVFALGEYLKSPGSLVIEAFVAAYEVQARVGLAAREARQIGTMVLSAGGTMGCAAAAAKMLGLDVERTTMALSVAASQVSGIGYQTGTMAHIVEMGISARNGIAAALLAGEGCTGQPDILEAPRGLLHIMTAGKVESPDSIIEDWGKPYRLLEVGIKQYPCCYHMQRLIEAAEKVHHEHGVSADDIEHIKVEVGAFFPTVVQHPEPRDEIEAQFSLPQALAAAFLDDRVLPSSFSRESIAKSKFGAFRTKVEVVAREDWGWTPTGWTPNMVFTLKDGRELIEQPTTSKGQPPNLLPFDDVIEKYENCLEPMLPRSSIDDSLPILADLEKIPDVSALVEAVRP